MADSAAAAGPVLVVTKLHVPEARPGLVERSGARSSTACSPAATAA